MRSLLSLIVLLAIAFGVYSYLKRDPARRDGLERAEQRAGERAGEATRAIRAEFETLDTAKIEEELRQTGKVVRKKSQEFSERAADVAADAKATATIKAQLARDSQLSSLSISVNTTDGLVTLAGKVKRSEDIKTAMEIAMATPDVREVTSTLQVENAPPK